MEHVSPVIMTSSGYKTIQEHIESVCVLSVIECYIGQAVGGWMDRWKDESVEYMPWLTFAVIFPSLFVVNIL